jgi:hypothetical protein
MKTDLVDLLRLRFIAICGLFTDSASCVYVHYSVVLALIGE